VERGTVKVWYLVHKWTSLVCTVFLLVTCVTGLPLIFHEELEEALGYNAPLEQVAAGTPRPSLDSIVGAVLSARPGEVVQYLAFDEERPVVTVGTAPTAASPPTQLYNQPVDLRTGRFVPPPPQNKGLVWFLEELHIRLFAGLPGTLFLGATGLVFLVSLVSGVVVYAPFMRKLPFGTLRRERSPRLKWLDLHNLVGVSIAAWLAVVGFTGVFNTLDLPLATEWKNGQLAEMVAPYRNAPPPTRLGSIDGALAAALAASPGMQPSSISFPGTFFSTPHHYNVFLRGASPVTSRLLKPALVDAQTLKLTDTRDMPLHIRALFLSRPLHFGDYGGLLLKLVWAGLDLLAILVLVSGLYLWVGRWRVSLDRRVDELETGAERDEVAA
jgi:uncharacterized iron-regulated membrane protein